MPKETSKGIPHERSTFMCQCLFKVSMKFKNIILRCLVNRSTFSFLIKPFSWNNFYRQGDNGSINEKYKYRWILPIHEIDIIEASVPIAYKLKAAHGRLSLVSSKEDGYTTYSKDLDNLLHDLPLIEEITNLVSQLRLDHDGLSKELMRSITKNLQTSIQIKNDVNKCILQFCASTK